MTRNNQNKPAAWVQRVREYDVVPDDVVYTEEESLKQLHKRFKNKPQKRRRYFYWAAAAAAVVIIALPLLLKKQFSNKGKFENETAVVKPATKKNVDKQLVENKAQQGEQTLDQKSTAVKAKKDRLLPIQLKDSDIPTYRKDTSAFLAIRDTAKINKSIAILQIKPDTINDKENAAIVHINNLNTPKPEQEIDNRKLLRFLRRYDVDVPSKNSAAGSTKNIPLLNNLN